MDQPLVSVIIAVYNGEKYIEQAIRSILDQNYLNLEVIVVDDGSKDKTAEVVNRIDDHRIVYIRQENNGQSSARNVGIRQSHGSILGFLDADDLWSHHHIETLIPFLEKNSQYDSARGHARFFHSANENRSVPLAQTFGLELVGAALFRRSVFDRVGLFDETMRRGEDLDWRMRFDEAHGKEKRVDTITIFCRRHDHNLTNSTEVNSKGRIEAFRKRLQRKHSQINQPLISVIMPVYNGERFISAAIQSILNQTYAPIEIIVIDDGSTDRTQAILEPFKESIRVITQENKGVSAARNAGLRCVTGTLVGFLDADDLWSHHHIESLLPAFINDPDCSISRGHMRFFRIIDDRFTEVSPKRLSPNLLGTSLFRLSALRDVGLFNETMHQGEDTDINLRLVENGFKIQLIEETTLFARRHKNNATNNSDKIASGLLDVIRQKQKRHLERN